jgi:hypothetical protein
MTHIKTAVIVLIIAMLLSLVFMYANLMSVISSTKSNTERVLDSFVIENATYFYNSIKNGNDFTASINANYYISKTSSELSLDISGGILYNRDEQGGYNFRMTNPQTYFTVSNTLNLTTTYDLLFPINFAGKRVMELRIPIRVKASYNLK